LPTLTWQQQGAHAVGGFAGQGRHDVAVDVHGRAQLAVAEQLHDHPRVDALGEQQGGRGVPAVVQPDVSDAGGLEQPGPVVVVGLLVDRAAVGLGEDQVLVVPLGAGQHLLAELGGLVPVQLGDEGHRQGGRALAAAGLGLLVDQPTAPDAVDAPPHGEGAGEQVDVLPSETSDPRPSHGREPWRTRRT